MELQEQREALEAQGLNVVAISFDSEEVLASFAERVGITYPLLSDEHSAAIRAFGILNTVAEEGLGANADDPSVKADVARYVSVFGANRILVGTPFPGTFVVDNEGRVTSRFFEEFYRERNTAATIMLRLSLETNPVSGTRGETPHLVITSSQTNAEVSAGSRIALMLDIEPNPNIHVYAPSADDLGYYVIALRLADNPLVQTEPSAYPASEIYHFEPLDERVPVYQRPFRLTQEAVVGASPEALEALADVDVITLTGQLDYQACDDAVCFEPVSVPVSWTLTVMPPDRQQANQPAR